MPIINEVAMGKRTHINVYGNDYPTPDGSPLRDYIHVVDVAMAHVKAVDYIMSKEGVHAFNIGTGRPCSVIEMIQTYSKVSNVEIPYLIDKRREGDVAVSYADVRLAREKLGFVANKSLDEMCLDAYRFVTNL